MCRDALDYAGLFINDIDFIIGAMATPLQAIPCNAALIHERIAKGLSIPAFDINSSCTSFITAMDIATHLLNAGTYSRILIVSGNIVLLIGTAAGLTANMLLLKI